MASKPVRAHYPNCIGDGWEKKLDKAVQAIKEDGVMIKNAVVIGFGCAASNWYHWAQWAIEDIENGYTSTPMLCVVRELCKADVESGAILSRKARKLALEDDNVEMLKFLLERRYGYKKETKQDVEVKANDDFNFNINLVDSKKEE